MGLVDMVVTPQPLRLDDVWQRTATPVPATEEDVMRVRIGGVSVQVPAKIGIPLILIVIIVILIFALNNKKKAETTPPAPPPAAAQ